jgi:lipopolysaccharide transport system ATP-binding protein
VDEVLAVGDAAFQKKCLGKMEDVAGTGRTVFLVSHNMAPVTRLCERVIWLESGRVAGDGNARSVVSAYLSSATSTSGVREWPEGIANSGIFDLKLYAVRVRDADGTITSSVDVQRRFSIELDYRIFTPLPFCRVGFLLTSASGEPVFESYDADDERTAIRRGTGSYTACCRVPGHLLNPGRYNVSIIGGMPNVRNLIYLDGALSFDIQDTGAVGSELLAERHGAFRPKLDWVIRYEGSDAA